MCNQCETNTERRLRKKLKKLSRRLRVLELQGDEIMADLTRLTAEVTETTTAVNSAIVLIEGLAQQIRDLSTDPAALNALADQLDQSGTELAEAVAANTVAEEELVWPPFISG